MSKKVIFNTLNKEAVESFSKYNVAYWELRKLRATFKEESKKIQEKIDAQIKNRKDALEKGMSADEVSSKYSTDKLYTKLNALKAQFVEDCKPHKEAQTSALEMLPDEVYYAYIKQMNTGSLDSTGSVTIGKETFELSKSMRELWRDYLVTIGVSEVTTNTVGKFINTLMIRTAGMIKCNKGEDYVKVKSAKQYKELVMLTFLQYLVNEKGVLEANETQELTLKKF